MSILVTGATGFIGSHLCRELVKRGHQVVGLTRSGKTERINSLLENKGFKLCRGDIQDNPAMQDIIKENGTKTVFHLAVQWPAESDMESPLSCFDTNARGSLSVLNAAYLGGVETFIYTSSIMVYTEPPRYLPVDEDHPAEPLTVYGVANRAGELCCHLYAGKLKTSVLRYSGVYGEGNRPTEVLPLFVKQARNNQPITIFGDGMQSSDFVYIDDVIQGTLLAWEKDKPGVYNIGSGEETSIRELADKILAATGSKSEVSLTDNKSERPFKFVLDISKAKRDLGYSPRTLDEGLRQYLGGTND